MEKMRFYWENGEKKGSFTVTALTEKECVKLANEELKDGYEMVDWHSVEQNREVNRFRKRLSVGEGKKKLVKKD